MSSSVLCSEIHLFYSKACIIKTSLSWANPLPWLTRMTTPNEKRVASQVWFVPFPPLDFMTKPLFSSGLTFLCGSFFFFSSSSLCPSQHSNNTKQKHKFTFSFILEHWWLLLWEHNFTDHFHRNCSIRVRKSLRVMVCNKQMSPYFWAQQHCMVPDLGFSHKYFLWKVHSKTHCSVRLHGAQTKRMLHLLSRADYSCRNFKGRVWVYSREYLCSLKLELKAQDLWQMALLLRHLTQGAPSHQVRSPLPSALSQQWGPRGLPCDAYL